MRSLRWLIPALAVVALASASDAKAIVSGAEVPIANHPYQVAVLMNAPDGMYSCGGVIIDSTHVVTAAHCAYFEDFDTLLAPEKFTVGSGNRDRSSQTPSSVKEVTIPSGYINDGSWDVALLELNAPLPNFNTASVKAIPLASAGTLATAIGTEAPAFATGWGAQTWNGAGTNRLRGVALPLRADAICSAYYGTRYKSARNVCAGGKVNTANAPDTCQGDSGGPLALDGGGGYELVGLTSYGYKCGEPNTAGVYTQTSDPDIQAVINGTAPASSTFRGSEWPQPSSGGGAPPVDTPPSQAPAPPPPVATPATRDTTRPTASVSKVSCTKKGRCTLRFKAADKAGTVARFQATLTRSIKRCARKGTYRYCNSYKRKKTVKGKPVSGGFSVTATLAKARYTLTAVATDAAGNRSKVITRAFTVRG